MVAEPHDSRAYLEEQIARQKRGEPVDTEWIRSELARINREVQQKAAVSTQRLRVLLVVGIAIFVAAWLASRSGLLNDSRVLLPVVGIGMLAIWGLFRQFR